MTLWYFRLVVLVLLLACYLEVSLSARGGGRGGGRSSGRSSSSHRSSSRSSSATYRPAITKYTPIAPKTRSSPVIVSQTKIGSRNKLNRMVAGYMFYRFVLARAPIYRSYVAMNRSRIGVWIPSERALRMQFTEEELLDRAGRPCLPPNQTVTLRDNLDTLKGTVLTTVSYGDGRKIKVSGEAQNITIRNETIGQTVEFVSLVTYNSSVVENSDCTQIKSVMNGTVVMMYQYNPDTASSLRRDVTLWLSSIVLLLLLK